MKRIGKRTIAFLLLAAMFVGLLPEGRLFVSASASDEEPESIDTASVEESVITLPEQTEEAPEEESLILMEEVSVELPRCCCTERCTVDCREEDCPVCDGADWEQLCLGELLSASEPSGPEAEEPATEEPTEEPTEEKSAEEELSFAQTALVNGVEIHVSAPAGVFPAGVELVCSALEETEEREAVDAAVEESRDSDRRVRASFGFDIKVLLNGAEVEPDSTKGTVSIRFTLAQPLKPAMGVEVYHVSESEGGFRCETMSPYDITAGTSLTELTVEAAALREESVSEEMPSEEETPAEEAAEAEEAATALSVDTDSFSYFVVEFSYDRYTYVLSGGSTVWLDELLGALGLPSGSISELAVSDANLLSVQYVPETNRYLLISLRPFLTAEKLCLSIDGVSYTLTITDGTNEYKLISAQSDLSQNRIFGDRSASAGNRRSTTVYFDVPAGQTLSYSNTNTDGDGSGFRILDYNTVVFYIPSGVTVEVSARQLRESWEETSSSYGYERYTGERSRSGSGAGVELPEHATLIVMGGGTLKATGGNASQGWDGENGTRGAAAMTGSKCDGYKSYASAGNGGRGGDGGGGAGAGIGTCGGNGGLGGEGGVWSAREATEKNLKLTDGTTGAYWFVQNHATDGSKLVGASGAAGTPGTNGAYCGTVYVLRNTTVIARAGKQGYQDALPGEAGVDGRVKHDEYYVGGGGGGGGCGGIGGIAADIGSGGGGGFGGGGGGAGSVWWALDDYPAAGGGLGGSRLTLNSVWMGEGASCACGEISTLGGHGGSCGNPNPASYPYGEIDIQPNYDYRDPNLFIENGALVNTERSGSDMSKSQEISELDESHSGAYPYTTIEIEVYRNGNRFFTSFLYSLNEHVSAVTLDESLYPPAGIGYLCTGLYTSTDYGEDELVFGYDRGPVLSNRELLELSAVSGKLTLYAREVEAEVLYSYTTAEGESTDGYLRRLSAAPDSFPENAAVTLTLLSNASLDSFPVTARRQFTIELNGYTIRSNSGSASSLFTVAGGSSLCLRNTADTLSTVTNSGTKQRVTVENHGSFTMEGQIALEALSTDEGSAYGIWSSNGNLTLSGGSSSGTAQTAGSEKVGAGLALSGGSLALSTLASELRGSSKGGVAAAVLLLDGGELVYDVDGSLLSARADYHCDHIVGVCLDGGKLSVAENSTLQNEGLSAALLLRGGSTKILGGGLRGESYAIEAPAGSTAALEILGGSLRGGQGALINDGANAFTISGGEFFGSLSGVRGGDSEAKQYSLRGGRYDYDVSRFCAESYGCIETEGRFEVLPLDSFTLSGVDAEYSAEAVQGYQIQLENGDTGRYIYVRARYYDADNVLFSGVPTHVGEYRVKVTAIRMDEQGVGHACSAECSFRITPRILTVNPAPGQSAVYSAEVNPGKLDYDILCTGSEPIAENDRGTLALVGELGVKNIRDAGEYPYDYSDFAVVRLDDGTPSADYEIRGSDTARFTVEKACYGVETAPVAKSGLSYNGDPLILFSFGSAKTGGRMLYSFTTDAAADADSLSYFDANSILSVEEEGRLSWPSMAGVYYLYYRIEPSSSADPNYTGSAPVSFGAVTVLPGEAFFDYVPAAAAESGSMELSVEVNARKGTVKTQNIASVKATDTAANHVKDWAFTVVYTPLGGGTQSSVTVTPEAREAVSRVKLEQAGTYQISYRAEAMENYGFGPERTATLEKSWSVVLKPVTCPELVYKDMKLTAVEYGSSLSRVQPDFAGTEASYSLSWEQSETIPVPGGGYKATLQPLNVSFLPVELTISAVLTDADGADRLKSTIPLTPRIVTDIEWENTEFSYDEKDHVPTAKVKNLLEGDSCGVNVLVCKNGSSSWQSKVIDVGNYTAKAVSLSDERYTLPEKSFTTAFAITEGSLKWVLAPDVVASYDGKAHSISLLNVPKDATVLYRCGSEEYGETKPSFTEVEYEDEGQTIPLAHRIYYKVCYGTESIEGSATVTITAGAQASFVKKPVAAPSVSEAPTFAPREYNGEEQSLLYSLALPSEGDRAVYAVIPEWEFDGDASDVSFSEKEPKAREPGFYYILCKIEGNNKPDSSTLVLSSFILSKALTVEWGSTELTYNGSYQLPDYSLVGLEGNDTVEPILGGAIANVGTSKAVLSLSAGEQRYYIDAEDEIGSVVFAVIPKVVSVTLAPESVEEKLIADGETSHMLVSPGRVESGKLLYALGDGEFSEALPEAVEAGGYTIRWKHVSDSANYTVADDSVHSLSKTILRPREPQEPVALRNLRYTGEPQSLIRDTQSAMRYSLDGLSWVESAEELKATEPGAYRVWYRALGDGVTTADSELSTMSESVVIGKCLVDIDLSDVRAVERSYNGGVVPELQCSNPHVSISACYADANVGSAKKLLINSIRIRTGDEEHYELAENLSILAKYEKGQAVYGSVTPLTATLAWGDTVFAYTGEAQSPTARVTNLQSSDYGLPDFCEVSVSGAQTEVGESYLATAVELSNENYALPEKASCSFSIVKSKPVYTVPKAPELRYTGEAQTLLVPGVSEHGHFEYALSGGTWSETIPTGSEQRDYSVRWRLIGDGNHENINAPEPIVVSIALGDAGISKMSEARNNLVYTGEAQPLFEAGTAEHGTFEYSLNGGEWTKTIPEGCEALSYSVALRLVPEEHYAPQSWESVSVTIAKAAVTVTAPAAASLSYNGTAQPLLIPGTAEGGSIVYELSGVQSESVPEGSEAGTYYIKWYVKPDTNYLGTEQELLTVELKPKTVELSFSEGSYDYDGNDHRPTATALGLIEGDRCTVTVSTAEQCAEAGSYTARAVALSNSNYALPEDSSFHYVIKPVAPTVKLLPLVRHSSYDGESHDLMYMGSSDDGVLLYSLDGYSWQSTPVSARNAGEYSILYKLIGDRNHTDLAPQTLEEKAVITPKTALLLWEKTTLPYNGRSQQPLVRIGNLSVGDSCGATVSVERKDGESSAAGKVGEYMATVTALDNPNYALSETVTERQQSFSIVKATADYENPVWSEENPVYTGQPQKLFEEGSYAGGVMQYRIEGVDEDWTDCSTPVTDAGSYIVHIRLLGDENHVTEESSDILTLVMDKAESSYLVTPELFSELRYTGKAQTLLSAGSSECGTVLYSVDGESWSEELPRATEVGTTPIYVKIAGDRNHLDSESLYLGEAEIQKALPALGEVSATDIRYGDSLSASTLRYSGSIRGKLAWTEDTLAEAVGTICAEATFTPEDSAHYESLGVSVTVSVKQRIAELEWAEQRSYPYDGKPHVPSVSVRNAVEGDAVTVTVGGEESNAGEYTATALSLSDERYVLSGKRSIAFTIEKAEAVYRAPEARTLRYTGEYQSLITPGESEDGSFLYAVGNGLYADTLPVLRAVGSYTVHWRFVGDNNHLSFTGEDITVEIKKAESSFDTLPTAVEGLVYTGKPQTLLRGGSSGSGTLLYSLDGKIWSEKLPSERGAGSYDCYAVIRGDAHHEDSEVLCIRVNVAKAVPKLGHVSAASIIYGQTLGASALSGKGSTPGSLVWAEPGRLLPAGRQRADVIFTPTDSGNYESVTISSELRVNPKTVELLWTPERFEYDEQSHCPTAEVKNALNAEECSVSVIGASSSLGSHRATAVSLSNSNYALPEKCSFDYHIEISYTSPVVTENLKAWDSQPLLKEGSTPYGVMEYRLPGGEWSSTVPVARAAGTFRVELRIRLDESVQELGSISVTVKSNGGGTSVTPKASPTPSPSPAPTSSPSATPAPGATAAPTPLPSAEPERESEQGDPTPSSEDESVHEGETQDKKKKLLPLAAYPLLGACLLILLGKRRKKKEDNE